MTVKDSVIAETMFGSCVLWVNKIFMKANGMRAVKLLALFLSGNAVNKIQTCGVAVTNHIRLVRDMQIILPP